MPSLTLKNIPPRTLEQLKRQAELNHRSLQGQMMHLIDEALSAPRPKLTLEEVYLRAKAMGLNSEDESVKMIREDRDSR